MKTIPLNMLWVNAKLMHYSDFKAFVIKALHDIPITVQYDKEIFLTDIDNLSQNK